MKKHAYLIIAHNKIEQLAFLLELLDNPRNDIFIHIDKKSDMGSSENLEFLKNSTQYSNVYFTPRINVYWGHYSQIESEVLLFEYASKIDEYYYYHLISGVDLPLRSQSLIHKFFDENPNKIFISKQFSETNFSELAYSVEKYNFFIKYFKHKNKYIRRLGKLGHKLALNIQNILKIDRLHNKREEMGFSIYSNWKSVPHDVVLKVVDNKPFIKKHFKYTFCCDEVYFQMVLRKENLEHLIYDNTPFKDIPTQFQGNLRYVNWWDGYPYEWTDSEKDINQLEYGIKLGHFFSRKFDLDKYPKLKDFILSKNK